MKNIILAGIAALTVCAVAPAFAADIPVRKAAPMAVAAPPMSWTGCYIGAGGGYAMWNQENRTVDNPLGVQLSERVTAGGRGYFGTVQGGCDYQFAPSWLVGVFADGDFSSVKGNPSFPGAVIAAGLQGSEKLSYSWAVGARAGYLITPQLLTYVAAGYTSAHFNRIDLSAAAPPGGAITNFINARDYSGWFLGTGYEYAITWLPGLTWKTEYRFSDYGTERNIIFATATGLPTAFAIDSHKYAQAVRSELVWRFNMR